MTILYITFGVCGYLVSDDYLCMSYSISLSPISHLVRTQRASSHSTCLVELSLSLLKAVSASLCSSRTPVSVVLPYMSLRGTWAGYDASMVYC